MKRTTWLTRMTLVVLGLLGLLLGVSGCGGGGAGGDGGGAGIDGVLEPGAVIELPDDAIVLDASEAKDVAEPVFLREDETAGGAAVLDTRGWTALYSARPTYQYDEAKTALCDRRLGYVVVERKELRYDSDRARTLRYLLETAGECVVCFEGPGGASTGAVDVYRWRAERFRPALRPSGATRVARSVTSREERVHP